MQTTVEKNWNNRIFFVWERKQMEEKRREATKEHEQFCYHLLQSIQCHDQDLKDYTLSYLRTHHGVPKYIKDLQDIQHMMFGIEIPNDLEIDTIKQVHTALLEYLFLFPNFASFVFKQMTQEIKSQQETFPENQVWETFSLQRQIFHKLWSSGFDRWNRKMTKKQFKSLLKESLELEAKDITQKELVAQYAKECHQKYTKRAALEAALQKMVREIKTQESFVPVQSPQRKHSNQ